MNRTQTRVQDTPGNGPERHAERRTGNEPAAGSQNSSRGLSGAAPEISGDPVIVAAAVIAAESAYSAAHRLKGTSPDEFTPWNRISPAERDFWITMMNATLTATGLVKAGR